MPHIMKLTMKIKAIMFLLTMLMVPDVYSQVKQPETPETQREVKVSDAELQKFAEAYNDLQIAQQELQNRMIDIIKDNDLDVSTFNEIHQAQLQERQVDVSEEDLKNHKIIVQKLEKMRPQVKQQLDSIIKEQDLTLIRYEEIADALQNNIQLQQRLQVLVKE